MATKPQTKEDLILVFDSGAQSIRCGLFDVLGRMVDFIKLPIQPYFSEQPGFAEQHPEYFWEKFCEASRQLLARNPTLTGNLVAVTLTTQRGVYINLDRDGLPSDRPSLGWISVRPTRSVSRLSGWRLV